MNSLPRLYAIADRQFGDPVEIGRRLLAGGARLIQIRDKDASAQSLVSNVQALMRSAPRDASIIVNDRVDVALAANAHGVHLGQEDLPAPSARELLGADALVGVSTHTLEQARSALELPVDYVAVGPVFQTSSKADPDPVVGLDGLEEVCRVSPLPIVAIGGIRLESVPGVLRAGARAVAVIQDLVGHPDIEHRTRMYLEVLGRSPSREFEKPC